ncbi:serine hydrolase [Aerosakkonemataceae cyanobacterium BLCC-F154]|uniref:Serine hydrolase n=1 Tax=Floridaenema fluviatile BLCC-F154 TaxID=3153640 RepID=A0ABV4YHE9_9CYAN
MSHKLSPECFAPTLNRAVLGVHESEKPIGSEYNSLEILQGASNMTQIMSNRDELSQFNQLNEANNIQEEDRDLTLQLNQVDREPDDPQNTNLLVDQTGLDLVAPVYSTSPLSQRVAEHLSKSTGSSGAIIFNLTTGEMVMNNPDAVFSTASTIKIGILYALLRRVDSDPSFSLNETINSGSQLGSNQGFPNDSIPDLQANTDYTLEFLAQTMIANSNNWATNLLIRELGFDRINQEFENLGLEDTILDRYTPGSGAPSNHGNDGVVEDYRAGFNNLSTPRDMIELLRQIHYNQNGLLSANSHTFFWETLGSDGNGGINSKGDVPDFFNSIYPSWSELFTLQNKSGNLSWNTPEKGRHYQRSEAGRMEFDNGQTILYTAFVNDASNESQAQQALRSVGYEIATEYADALVTYTPEPAALDDGRIITMNGTDGADVLSIDPVPGNVDNDEINIFINGNSIFDRAINQAEVDKVRISAGAGNDRIFASRFEDVVDGGPGDDLIRGEDNDDSLYGDTGNDEIHGDRGNDFISGNAGNDKLHGGNGNDSVNGGNNDDELHGGNGNDLLEGRFGDDTLYGGPGNDTLEGWTGNDVLYGEQGNDVLRGQWANDTLDGGDGNDALYGSVGNDFLHGKDDDDTLYGGSDDDELRGGRGNDRLNGQNGNDTLRGNRGNDLVVGGDGNDLLYGNEDDDILFGGLGTDTLNGGSGNDYLDGVSNNQVSFVSSEGQYDLLTGEGGADKFGLYASYRLDPYYTGYGYAVITDFDRSEGDKIVISDAGGYSLGVNNWRGSAALDTGIYYGGNLIGIVQDNANVNLYLDFERVAYTVT